MQSWQRVLLGLAVGLLFPAAVVGIAALAPYANDQFITPIDGRILSIAWWFMVPLGTAAAAIVARRLWPGIVVGVASVFGFAWSLVLLLPVAERAAALASAAAWVSAAVSVALPWAIGMVLGSNSLHRRPVRRDGVPRDTTKTGSAVR
jgi:MFS family permease